MIEKRNANDRGHVQLDWLNSFHTFSFGHYHDPAQMGWSALRVINDDTVRPGQGFGTHGHRNMEIVSYVLDGSLQHQDSMGTGSVIKPGDVQVMSAGTGVQHSEFNPSDQDPVNFLQIWLLPNQSGVEPVYQERHFSNEVKQGQLKLLVSETGEEDSLRIHQDTRIYAALLNKANPINYAPPPGRHTYIHAAKGTLHVNGLELNAGDGLKIADEPMLTLAQGDSAELLLFDLP